MNVYIMSGPSGSGKSFQADGFAKVLDSEGEEGVIISTDHFWSDPLQKILKEQGAYAGIPFSVLSDPKIIEALKVYNFDIAKLSEGHRFCMRGFIYALEEEVRNIVIDNTNIRSYEIAPYYLVGESFGATVEILRVETSLDVCIKRNIHKVPEHVITNMHETFNSIQENPWTGEEMSAEHMPWWESKNI